SVPTSFSLRKAAGGGQGWSGLGNVANKSPAETFWARHCDKFVRTNLWLSMNFKKWFLTAQLIYEPNNK
ncbi:hypothetical protein, partial [Acidiphilium sp.]|uniref:hypothetical protein n=1 Tax=Acidiphilium sp. TaxID=527 RepID=UPI003D07C345